MKKENQTLLKRLQHYSALAAPMLATAGVVNAQVVYKDINPDVTLSSPGDSMLLDLNNDGIFDYTFRTVQYTVNWFRACMAPANISGAYIASDKNAIVGYHNLGTGGTVYPYVSALSLGHPINSSQPMFVLSDIVFNSTFLFPVLHSVFNSYHYGQWQDGTDHFAGLKFTPDGGTTFYFGWARCLVSTDAKTITIKDCAYQSEAGTPIAAGEGVNVGIQMADDDVVKIFSFDHSLNVNFRALNLSDATIQLFDILGQEILKQKVTDAQNVISLRQLPTGNYLVQVICQGKRVSKKIFLN